MGSAERATAGRTVLVVDGDTPLGRALVRLLRQSGYRVAMTCRQTDKPDPSDDGSDVVRAPWGKASAVSARNIMLRTLTAFERIDSAVFTFSPSLKRVLLHESEYVEIEKAVDDWIRGTLFLLKEVLGQLVRQGSGLLVLAQSFTGDDAADYPPLEAMVRGAIDELCASILASYGGEGVKVYRFETVSPKTDEYARFITNALTAAPARASRARAFRFRPSGGGLLDRLPLPGRRTE